MEEKEGRVEGREEECPCLGSLSCGATGRVGDNEIMTLGHSGSS
jgi:hypothetical protein